MADPMNRAFQTRFLALLKAKEEPTALRLLAWFADASYGLGCLAGALQIENGEPELDLGALEENIIRMTHRGAE